MKYSVTTYPPAPQHSVRTLDGVLQYAPIGDLELETGGVLPDVVLGYETWGTLNSDASNAVLIPHALTGSTHVAQGSTDEPGWWDGLVGPGRTIDTNRFYVVSINMVGGCYGSTGPASADPEGLPWGSRFPFVTIRDSVHAEARLADQLGIRRWHTVLGGSLGGARALEWAVTEPERVARCAVIAATAASTGEQIAFAQAQVAAIRLDPDYNGGDYYNGRAPLAGLGLARRIAHITYRSEAELQYRFGRTPQPGEDPLGAALPAERGRYQVESYLDHQGQKLASRFDANSYVILTEALMSHDVARGRGSLTEALAATESQFLVAAVDSDRLYFPEQSFELAAALPGDNSVHLISAPIGHDGFLTDVLQLREVLEQDFFA
ncbi:homoserine O-acetyltransferase MetX [Arthrobacter sp. Edens01]|uniref:homoserine O-acetyltransferase MetX n=1 Tax=Arthrobacter sp. Edens01 TaxID=1732020 RepID=UPI0006D9E7FA|nr:homoserine O-acetyltransferase [Arthrobacter sp. Edens01]KPN17908.1 homoserine O-acetyltransferase [Arthrobacter sp. Edens01]